MGYSDKWESLSAATERLMQSTGCSQEQGRWDLGRAISDGVIGVRAKLASHDIRPLKSTTVVFGNQLRIPTDLKPEDFNWQTSQPVKPWFLCDVPRHHHGPWQLAHIEVSSSDVTAKLLSQPTANPSAAESDKQPKQNHRESPQLKAAQIAINGLWPKGVPPQHVLRNDLFVSQVNKGLKQNGWGEVSRDTILRAAGRRK